MHPVDHEFDQIQPGQNRGEHLGYGGCGQRDEAAGDGELASGWGLFGDPLDEQPPD
jgi:hypothetical protein